ncbi:60S ribosomal protein L9 (nucleomorph) [Cryptomonas paramecium]|uniref:60S ribosomal protein L9 n=1 Tax=Cryptomonas paramaecium TaxID=2898 RepID=F2HI15_9CRYP|nr:60S ribosomal protein L9 [Cryptomonas paramecium]AEA38961.1 60S ribosomal protein L9 [Cryptomonas paramecium]
MLPILSSRKIKIPKGVHVKLLSRKIEVRGPKGVLTRNFKHILIDMKLKKKKKVLYFKIWHGDKKKISSLNTIVTLISNLITGVLVKFEYRMRFVYAHFPINVTLSNDKKVLEIRNFLGEKKVRKVIIPNEIQCIKSEKMKDEILVRGTDVNMVSLSAASIHQACLVKRKDIRKFLDGIYIHKINIVS